MSKMARTQCLIACAALLISAAIADETYAPPEAPTGTYLLETFQGKLKDLGWTMSEKDKYEGEFKISSGSKTYIPGDTGLYVPEKAMHYAMAKQVDVADTTDQDFVVQYQVRYDEYPTCGGSYLKLVKAPFSQLDEWDDQIPYSIMFGPDKCGSTSKVHFIVQLKNPKTGELVEHHLTNPPKPSADKDNHLYTLAIFRNQSFALLVDNEIERVGSMLDDFEPPVQPLEEIDDPEDKKPKDWVDEDKIPDPEAKKPDDWDEEAPARIPDPDAEMPEGWLEDEPTQISDPAAKKPDGWDDEEDGEWQAPLIDNPKCSVGCGKWRPPRIDNPNHKGKWRAPLIDNPDYKGEWTPRKIPNPDFYKVERVEIEPISAVGVEIWTMDKGYIFDNILIGNNLDTAREFARNTFGEAKKVEEEQKQKEIEEMAKKKSFYEDDKKPEAPASEAEDDVGEEIALQDDDGDEGEDEKAEL
mmetsp:Transcript_10058/g.30728  ORF Transcript_10058/g.30728 Transcript_10058/m.30728 type:complete len:469 (+) Transcript_10058:63-1469(+)|eukprot:CAMPEP_0198736752 /NCGR_PEP_ID=MMETSP1475-20131203/67517_1 /TAXON_ID= ORGANISM="Unidentified sp., Strain CCMP1999" /NCGR_SAMPLE_ID=MMETSP1475 /ASSEMBLY_ACC=CAM_ASM_001111 /LENGTH=468 /DNA_ID=CAMNT_0044500601 /DNA_START=47 /DNA_END=1453 /DNA_ORIENTATION=+